MGKIPLRALRVILLSIFFVYAGVPLRAPEKIGISTYSVNDYSRVERCNDLSRSIADKKRFVEQMTEQIKAKYPNTTVQHIRDRVNESATANNFLTDNTDDSEIVFFSGHGEPQTLFFYDREQSFGTKTKRFGGKTRWVFLEACMFLNVNKSDRLSADITKSENIDYQKVAIIFSLFNGVHAIMGNYADGWQGIIKKHWYSSAHWRTEDRFNYFAKYFVKEEYRIWDAYVSAVKKVYKNFTENSALGYYTSITGYKPAIAYFYLKGANGNALDMSLETYGKSYDAPASDGSLRNYQIKIKSIEIGSPRYY